MLFMPEGLTAIRSIKHNSDEIYEISNRSYTWIVIQHRSPKCHWRGTEWHIWNTYYKGNWFLLVVLAQVCHRTQQYICRLPNHIDSFNYVKCKWYVWEQRNLDIYEFHTFTYWVCTNIPRWSIDLLQSVQQLDGLLWANINRFFLYIGSIF